MAIHCAPLGSTLSTQKQRIPRFIGPVQWLRRPRNCSSTIVWTGHLVIKTGFSEDVSVLHATNRTAYCCYCDACGSKSRPSGACVTWMDTKKHVGYDSPFSRSRMQLMAFLEPLCGPIARGYPGRSRSGSLFNLKDVGNLGLEWCHRLTRWLLTAYFARDHGLTLRQVLRKLHSVWMETS